MTLIITLAISLSFMVPLTPGNLGAHQLICVLVLQAFRVEEAAALAFSIGLQGAGIMTFLLFGGVVLFKEGLDFKVS